MRSGKAINREQNSGRENPCWTSVGQIISSRRIEIEKVHESYGCPSLFSSAVTREAHEIISEIIDENSDIRVKCRPIVGE